MGQKEPVQVVNFVSEGTIEHGMLSVHVFKKSVFAGVLDCATDRVFMGEGAMKRFMKTVESAMDSTPTVQPTPADTADRPSTNGNGKHARLDDDDDLQLARDPAKRSAAQSQGGIRQRRKRSAAMLLQSSDAHERSSAQSLPDNALDRPLTGPSAALESRSLGEWLSQGAYLLGTIAR